MNSFLNRYSLYLSFPFFAITTTPIFCHSQIPVNYLTQIPVIDGVPDSSIANKLASINLTEIRKYEPADPEYLVRLRMGYNIDFLYLLLDINTDSIQFRDRAFQNGDGFHLTIAKPKSNNEPSDEFYVLRFSPDNSNKNEPARIEKWYYNIELDGRPLGSEAMLKTATLNGKRYYEALIPWKLIHPYHPLASQIGFNFCFVKAVGEKNKDYYFLRYDPKMQSEQQRRLYSVLIFDDPAPLNKRQIFLWLNKNNCFEGDTLNATAYILSDTIGSFTLNIQGYSGDGERVFFKSVTTNLQRGLNKIQVQVPGFFLATGGYYFLASLESNKSNNAYLTILPKINLEKLNTQVSKLKITEGSKNTLLYRINELKSQF